MLSLTNEGVAYARLGDYACAMSCFDRALAGYVEGEFATSGLAIIVWRCSDGDFDKYGCVDVNVEKFTSHPWIRAVHPVYGVLYTVRICCTTYGINHPLEWG